MSARGGQSVAIVIPIVAFVAVFRIFVMAREVEPPNSASQDAVGNEVAALDVVEQENSIEPEATEQPKPAKKSLDDRFRGLIVGTWKRDSYGSRLLTIRQDGTGTMVIKPDFFSALAFGKKIVIDIKWKIENGRAIYRMISGKPRDKAEMARKQFGDRWDEKILELTEKHLLLLGEDKQSRYKWMRVVSESS